MILITGQLTIWLPLNSKNKELKFSYKTILFGGSCTTTRICIHLISNTLAIFILIPLYYKIGDFMWFYPPPPFALALQASDDSPIHISQHMNRREYKPLLTNMLRVHYWGHLNLNLKTWRGYLATFKKRQAERYTEKYLVSNQYHLELKMFRYI